MSEKKISIISNFLFNNKPFVSLSIFSILLFLFFPINWTDNELHYFGMGVYTYDQSHENYSYFHYSKLKFLVGFINGFLIDLFGIEKTWFYLRIFTLFGFTFFIIKFCQIFNFNNLNLLLSLILFIILGQNFIAGSWLFEGFESKVISYLIFFYSFILIIEKRFKLYLFLSFISLYSHFQAAFFCISFNLLFYILLTKNFEQFIKLIIYLLLISVPIISLILYEANYFTHLNINQIFFERVYAQSSIFDLENQVNKRNLIGILIMLFFLFFEIISYYLLKNKLNEKIKTLVISLIISKLYFFIAIILDYLFKENLSTFFIYRFSSILLLLTLLVFFKIIFKNILKLNKIFSIAPFVLIIIFFIYKDNYNVIDLKKKISSRIILIKDTIKNYQENEFTPIFSTEESEIIKWITNNTRNDAIILIEENIKSNFSFPNLKATAFEKNVKRPTLVNFHNIFGSKKDIERWYNLYNFKKGLFNGNCDTKKNFSIDYLLYFDNDKSKLLQNKCKFTMVYSSNNLTLLKTNK